VTTGAWLLLSAGVLLVLVLGWTAWTLTRLRRLGARVRRAWEVLDAALLRRAELAAAVARDSAAQLGRPAAGELAAAAAGARSPAAGDREAAENALTRELRRVPAALRQAEAPDADVRVGLARRFYNDAVRDTRALRRRRPARLLRLHAGHPMPRYFDIDDGLDAVVGAPATRGGPTGT
jgi:hypothetical protein